MLIFCLPSYVVIMYFGLDFGLLKVFYNSDHDKQYLWFSIMSRTQQDDYFELHNIVLWGVH